MSKHCDCVLAIDIIYGIIYFQSVNAHLNEC